MTSQSSKRVRASVTATSSEQSSIPALPVPIALSTTLTALDIFTRCVERANNLLKIHKAAHGKKSKPEKFLADAHRAAIVLAISALDSYIRTFVASRIRMVLADRNTSLPPSLCDKIKSFLKDDQLLEAARKDDLIERVDKAFRKDFEKRTFQGTSAISDALKLVGIDDVFHDVARKAQENEDTLRQKIDAFTHRRHTIAHRGDYNLDENPPVENPITKKEAEECIRLVCVVAETIDTL
ncbi:MAG: HEPN domain-containing protein [Chthoniobacterales bacterium]